MTKIQKEYIKSKLYFLYGMASAAGCLWFDRSEFFSELSQELQELIELIEGRSNIK